MFPQSLTLSAPGFSEGPEASKFHSKKLSLIFRAEYSPS